MPIMKTNCSPMRVNDLQFAVFDWLEDVMMSHVIS